MQTDSRGNDRQPCKGHNHNMQAEGAAGPGAAAAETGSGVLALQLALRALHLHELQGSPQIISDYNEGFGTRKTLFHVLALM